MTNPELKAAHMRLCYQWAATEKVHEWSHIMSDYDLPVPSGENERLCSLMDGLWTRIVNIDVSARHETTTYGRRTYCERVICGLQ